MKCFSLKNIPDNSMQTRLSDRKIIFFLPENTFQFSFVILDNVEQVRNLETCPSDFTKQNVLATLVDLH